MFCAECYETTLPECVETITLNGGLANGNYWVEFENRFGQRFTDRVASTEGVIELDLTRFPDYQALFSHTAGTFCLAVKKQALADCDPETLTLCGEEYTCVKITFTQVFNATKEQLAAEIPCCKEEGGEG